MKKIYQIALLAIATFSLSSCYKTYTCECVTTDNSSGSTQTSTSSSEMPGFRKKDAKTSCESGNNSYSSGTYTTSTVCSIK